MRNNNDKISCPPNFLLVEATKQRYLIMVKHLVQGRNNVTKMRLEPRSCDQDCHKNDAFALLASCRRFC